MSGRAGGMAADDRAFVDIAHVIDDVRERLPPDRASRVEVRMPAGLTPVQLPRRSLAQALLSLVKNAFDATVDDVSAVVVEVSQDAERCRVAVQDRGPGLSPEALQRVGEPFYTTKEPGRGLGLGLFLARVFAERFGGTLTLESRQGTIAVLELPLRSEPVRLS